MLKDWFLAARPKTLFVSVSPVLAGCAFAYYYGCFNLIPAIVCLLFALLAQITSNFVNDYADFKKGADRDDRVGPERAVASGAISAKAMLRATIITIGLALLLGSILIVYGGYWLIGIGLLVAIFAFAYSCGPYPLSYHGLGDVAVLIFYGIVPVVFTYYVQGLSFPMPVFFASIAIGLMGVNLLIVNNYRDMEADAISGKRTTVVRFGRKNMRYIYLINFVIAYNIGYALTEYTIHIWLPLALPSFIIAIRQWQMLETQKGKALNKVLGLTAFNVFVYSLALSLALIWMKLSISSEERRVGEEC